MSIDKATLHLKFFHLTPPKEIRVQGSIQVLVALLINRQLHVNETIVKTVGKSSSSHSDHFVLQVKLLQQSKRLTV